MELQLCNYDKKSNTTCDMQCNFIIIILTIIYNILIGIIIFIYQPIEVIKEVEVIKKVETEERALALQTAYEERANIALKKWSDAYIILWDNRKYNYTIKNEKIGNNRYQHLMHYNEEIMNQNWDKKHIEYNMLLMLLGEENEQYFVNEEKIARKEAFIAIKKANLFESIDTITRGNYAHLFNS